MLARTEHPSAGTETRPALPKTAALCRQWKRCGKPACHCVGGQQHGPYFCMFWREGGRLRKRYVQQARVLQVQAEFDGRRARRRLERNQLSDAHLEWRALLTALRELERVG